MRVPRRCRGYPVRSPGEAASVRSRRRAAKSDRRAWALTSIGDPSVRRVAWDAAEGGTGGRNGRELAGGGGIRKEGEWGSGFGNLLSLLCVLCPLRTLRDLLIL